MKKKQQKTKNTPTPSEETPLSMCQRRTPKRGASFWFKQAEQIGCQTKRTPTWLIFKCFPRQMQPFWGTHFLFSFFRGGTSKQCFVYSALFAFHPTPKRVPHQKGRAHVPIPGISEGSALHRRGGLFHWASHREAESYRAVAVVLASIWLRTLDSLYSLAEWMAQKKSELYIYH